ncbi:hypothetical protein K438DRAFT_1862417 [Mycena galopus ATCC 62051]|nr:hypothetical protein K438DRAFT_1862417 [Mycena galopus ATCC 62051]
MDADVTTNGHPTRLMVSFASFEKESKAESVCLGPHRAYPVLSLPTEIMGEIFMKFLPSYPERPPHVGIFSPLMLCQICGPWRRIALSTPSLWRAVSIELHDRENQWKLELLETWLSRSGACLLSIHLHYHLNQLGPGGHTTYPSLSQFLHTVVRRCERWEHMDCIMPFEHLHIIQGGMPQLRDLKLGPSDLPDDDNPTKLELFDRAPRLTDVVLADCFVPACMRLPWSQLTCLEGLCLFEHEFAAILSDATELTCCTVTLCGPSEPVPMPMIPIHSLLRVLVIYVTNPSNVILAGILDSLTLPALRTLEVPERHVSRGDAVDTLKRLVSRSRCTLDELGIKKASLPEDLYRRAFPSLRTLTLSPPPSE